MPIISVFNGQESPPEVWVGIKAASVAAFVTNCHIVLSTSSLLCVCVCVNVCVGVCRRFEGAERRTNNARNIVVPLWILNNKSLNNKSLESKIIFSYQLI
jgi:hypothetical protein